MSDKKKRAMCGQNVIKNNSLLTFIAPLVAIALNDTEVRNVHKPQKATSNSDSPMPAIPTILYFHINRKQFV